MQKNKIIINERNQSLMQQYEDDINLIEQTGFSYTIVEENKTLISCCINLDEIIIKKLK